MAKKTHEEDEIYMEWVQESEYGEIFMYSYMKMEK
jgi:hypothetical protein